MKQVIRRAPFGVEYLMVRDGDRLLEDYPLHNFATWRGGQGTCVPVIAAQGCRQEVPEDERIQKGLLLCVQGKGKEKHNDKSRYAADTVRTPGLLVPSQAYVCLHPEERSIRWQESHRKQHSTSQGVLRAATVH